MMTVDEALNHAQNELESAFEKWLSDECPSGDCESVQRQWDKSFVHQELVDELQPVMALTWEVRRLREENERIHAATPQQSPWQPIATAPKDGTHILLSYPGRVTYGYWLEIEVGKLVGDCGGVCRCPEYDEPPDPSWYSEDGGFTEEHPPTHWMPLPEPAP